MKILKWFNKEKEIDSIQALQNAMDKLNEARKKNVGVKLTTQETKIIHMNMFMLIRTP